jgi:hypothetical protein
MTKNGEETHNKRETKGDMGAKWVQWVRPYEGKKKRAGCCDTALPRVFSVN